MPPRATARQNTVKQCLKDLQIDGIDFFASCTTRDDEFRAIKKQFHRGCLQHHPDKGGDAEAFRRIRTSFELLSDLHDGTKPRKKGGEWLFSECLREVTKASTSVSNEAEEAFDMPEYDFSFTPSWDFYEAAAETEMPLYRVELAKSGRSRCNATGKYKKCDTSQEREESTDLVDLTATPESLIFKDEVRVGWLNEQTGTYGAWKHLRCWRIPSKVR